MNMRTSKQKFKFFLPYFLLALAIIVAFRITGEIEFFANGFRRIWGIISPFFAGFMLAYIINIPISGIQKLLAKVNNDFVQRRQKMLSVFAMLLIIAGIIGLALNFIVPAIQTSIEFLNENIPVYMEAITRVVYDFYDMQLFGLPPIDAELIFSIVGEIFAELTWEQISQPLNVLMGVGTAVFNGAIAFISSIYILVEKDRFKGYLRKLIAVFAPESVQTGIFEIFGGLNNNVRTYIRTQTIDGIILGTMATIFLWAIGSPFAVILGIMLGIVNYIPYFGSIFGTAVAVIVVTITQGIGMGAISAAALLIIQQIDANIIQPRLMSDSFSLSPLLVIISITFGGAIAGILGMFVAIPVVAVLKDIFDAIVEYYERKKFGEPMVVTEAGEFEENEEPDEVN